MTEGKSPWDKMREARERESLEGKQPARATLKQTLQYLMKISFVDYLKLQFPKADEVEDNDRYLAWFPPKENAAVATWNLVKKRRRPDRQRMRKPVIIAGRRIGVVGVVLTFLVLVISTSIVRAIFS